MLLVATGSMPTKTKKQEKRKRQRQRRRNAAKAVGANTTRKPLTLTPVARAKLMGTADKIGTAFRCLTLPRETRPLRFPHQGDVQQTAVFKLFNEGILEHNPQTSDNFLVSGFLLCPSPVYPVWTTQLSTLSQVWATASWAPVIDNNSATLNGFTEFTLSS